MLSKWQSTKERREKEKKDLRRCLINLICDRPQFGSSYIKQMGVKHGKDYMQSLKDDCNKERLIRKKGVNDE